MCSARSSLEIVHWTISSPAATAPHPAANAKVLRDLGKIARGKKLPPILLVRGDAGRDLPLSPAFACPLDMLTRFARLRLHVADGMHRLSAAWHHDESGDVACAIVDRPKG